MLNASKDVCDDALVDMKLGDMVAYKLIARVTQETQFSVIHPEDDAVLIDAMKAHRCGFQQDRELIALAPQFGFAFSKRFKRRAQFLVILLRCQVRNQDAECSTRIGRHRVDGQKNRHSFAIGGLQIGFACSSLETISEKVVIDRAFVVADEGSEVNANQLRIRYV